MDERGRQGSTSMDDQRDGNHWGQALSDLADGRADAAGAGRISAAWAQQSEVRRDWHALHLIGDTLRSAELGQQAQSSADLLAGLRARLAAEPVPLRPRRLLDWMAPLAVAAGFVALALFVPSLQGLLLPQVEQATLVQGGGPPPLGQAFGAAGPSFVDAAGLQGAALDEPQLLRPVSPLARPASGVTSDGLAR